jgi:hypothetical protein
MRERQRKFFMFNGRFFAMDISTNQEIELNEITCKQVLGRQVKNIDIKKIRLLHKEPEVYEVLLLDLTFLKQVWGSVAIQQALRQLNLTYEKIGAVVGVAQRTVWNNVNATVGVYSWADRENQENLLSVATFINHIWGA